MDNLSINEMQKLLDNVRSIDEKYKSTSNHDFFNIFSLLRKETDEVYLHSRFIGELLDPKGSHHQKDLFLRLFIDGLSKGIIFNNGNNKFIKNDVCIDIEKARLDIEWVDNSGDGNNRIDLVIRTSNSIIIIENKLYAADQPKQLTRYYEYALKHYKPANIHLVYLTLYGHEPSLHSIEKLSPEANVILLSYKDDIKHWLEKCIEQNNSHEPLLHTLKQYLTLIKKLTGQSVNHKKQNEVINLISKDNNAIYAMQIFDAWQDVKYLTIITFFEELDEQLKYVLPNYSPVNFMRFNTDNIWQIVFKQSNQYKSDGIMFKLCQYSEVVDVCILIEPSWGQLRFGALLINRANGFKIEEGTLDENELFTKAREKILSMENFKLGTCENSEQQWLADITTPAQGWWLVLVEMKIPDVQLFNFSTADTIKLANPEERNIFIKRLVNEIQIFSNNILDLFVS